MGAVQTLHLGLLAPVLLLIFLVSSATSCTEQEVASLLQFLHQLSPDSGNKLSAGSWQDGASCCVWEGVTCDSNGTVTELSLPSNGLEGNISASLANLTGLRRLDLSRNSLSGGLPLQLMSSGSIIVLDVSFNRLSGELQDFPSSLLYHPLQVLNISNNLFYGGFPSTAWEKKRDLVEINASHNHFSGGIPSSLCVSSRASLAVLDLSYNQFTGGIPTMIGECSALRVLMVGNNMSGELPSALGSSTSLRIINLKRNNFSGDLSKINFSGLHNLEILDLRSNNFTGEIPETIYSCTKLTTLHLSSNRFHGQLSPSLANLNSLSSVSLANNAFKNISNALHALSNFKSITTLLMGVNFWGEVMPDDIRIIEGFQSLQVLSLGSCLLSGKVPIWLSKLARLEILDLSNNELTGPIPVWINRLNFLYFLDMSNNRLTEDLPLAVMEMPMLRYDVPDLPDPISTLPLDEGAVLNLGNNQLTGAIPSEIGQLKSLVVLNLSFNSLSGDIPQEVGNLINLQVMDLSNNTLTGPIPSTNNLHSLSIFIVFNNDLEGEIPAGHAITLVYGNPKLCGPLVGHDCASAEGASIPTLSTEPTTGKIIFAIAFGAFFFVGVLYDQIVLSRFFGKPCSSFHAGLW